MSDRSDALVLFGVTGDLARRKLLPALHELARAGLLPDRIIGVASRDWDDEQLAARTREAVAENGARGADPEALERLLAALTYLRGDYRDPTTFDRIREAVGTCERPLIYLAIPPSAFQAVVEGLARVGLNDTGRVMVEKPFGRDLESARHLNRWVLRAFPEASVFRVDHFLGKEEVLDLLVFRLANTVLEPAWNRHYVDSVQITMAEDFGVQGRGRFFEEVGTLRDVVQNHLLQLVALVAMEPPVSAGAESLRDEKVKVLQAMGSLDPAAMVRGQFRGYRNERGVAGDSQVETFVALRAEIESWRWAGVPFFIRAGKHLPVTATEILVEFKRPPRLFFAHDDAPPPHPNHLLFRVKPDEQVSLSMQIKRPGEELVSRPFDLTYRYEEHHEGVRDDAYARLLSDAMSGDQRLFARSDAVEEAWRILQDALDRPPPVVAYEPGSWGPREAEALVADDGGWHDPEGGGA